MTNWGGGSDWDYVIVGAGSAGCVIANRLSEQPSARVLLIEAGFEDRSVTLHVPAGLLKIPPRYDWHYPAQPDTTRNGMQEWSAGGRVVGGGSTINGMLWSRGNAADFEEWTGLGCKGWDYASLLPHFKRSERFEGGADEFRGGDGPQSVAWERVSHPMTERFIAAAVESGHYRNPDYNGASQLGVSHTQLSQRHGLRHSTARAFLAPARRRGNLKLLTQASVTRILFDGNTAIGVEYVLGGRTVRAAAAREVVVCAGAIVSPKLLMLSGIGPLRHLRERGIPVLADSPGVGGNLQDHAHAALMYDVSERTLNQEVTPLLAIRHAINFAIRRRGALTSPYAHAVVFGRLSENSPRADYEVQFSPYGLITESKPADAGAYDSDVRAVRLDTAPVVAMYPCILHPKSRGTIRLRSSDPGDSPMIDLALMEDPDDGKTLGDACRKADEIFTAPSMRGIVVRRRVPPDPASGEDDWHGYASAYCFSGQHLVGTCKMGVDADAVVDPQLRVRGVQALRVIDASVMPTITSGNTNAPTIVIAERGAEFIQSSGCG